MTLMQRASQLHSDGQIPQALIAFEEALHNQPGNLDASSATATMLSLLGRQAAAYSVLRAVEPGLLETADGATNLAIAAESCGDLPKAYSSYERALELDPENLRALTNVGLIAAGMGQWDMAIACTRKCVSQQPAELSYIQTLSDVMTSAGRYPEALEVLDKADKALPGYLDITIRRIVVLAFSGDLEGSTALEAGLNGSGRAYLREFLAQPLLRSSGSFELLTAAKPFNALQVFAVHTYAAMAECDWRNNARLCALIRLALSAGHTQDFPDLGKDSQFYSLTLDLNDSELVQLNTGALAAASKGTVALLPPFAPGARAAASAKDERIRIGFAVQELRQIPALKQLLLHCNAKQFAFHVYSFAPSSEPYEDDVLKPLPIALVEMAHLTDAEAVGRIRLDALDIYVDTTPDAHWHRPGIAGARVAKVQLRKHNWLTDTPGCWDYTVSDKFVHCESIQRQPHSAVVRLASSCWLACHAEQPAAKPPAREVLGLPADGLVLCSQAVPASLDAFSFSQWMKILRLLPDAVLWLPACHTAAAAHLVREVVTYGVQATRLVFLQPVPAPDMLASLAYADLVLDTLRINQGQGIEDALRLGVPAITCAGHNMASRLGGSILHAAGLPECVYENEAAYTAGAMRLGRDADALGVLRARVAQVKKTAPFFDLASRVREWEFAWTTMAERSRAGLVPAAFDVPQSGRAAN